MLTNTHAEVEISHYPECDFCIIKIPNAHYDGRTKLGPWACMCEHHFKVYGVGLGLGKGQRFIIKEA